ncbi:hypothetical protein WJX84_002742 [Apatococcus fuscideae]|uniref:CBF1-interacting co-repressor CIR N-terminal domain-containing protein n=1 Tax=Apatococcus fuscideae TaxID=2026836 RepID=A0AAW1SI65_9CHLO
MPKGGPLSFLNKKTWHPGNSANQERLWKKEQEHAAELKRLEDFKKQIAEERQKKELEDVAVAAGVKVQQDRLDWMYQGSMMAKQEAQQRQEESMLEGKPVLLEDGAAPSKAESVALLPSFYAEDTPASANETWARLHSDPLFAIKQQEIAARKRIMANPVQMDAIKDKVKLSKEAKREAKAAAKAARKEAKKAANNMEAEMAAARQGVALDRNQSNGHANGAPSHRDKGQSQHSSYARDERPHHREAQPQRYDDPHHRSSGRKRSMSPPRDERTLHKRPRSSEERSGRPDHGYGRPHDNRTREDRPRGNGHRSHHSSDARDRRDGGYRAGRDEARDQVDSRGGEARQQHANGGAAKGRPEARGEEAEHGGPVIPDGYGLRFGGHVPEGQHRRDKAQETQERLEKAAQTKAEEEAAAAKLRHVKTEYKTGRLTEEEKQRRLAEMSGNANVHEEARWQRLEQARKKDDAEDATLAVHPQGDKAEDWHYSETAKFMQRTGKGLAEGVATLEDRVGRAKFYQDRGSSDRAAFRR